MQGSHERISFGYQMIMVVWFLAVLPLLLVGYYLYNHTTTDIQQSEMADTVKAKHATEHLISGLSTPLLSVAETVVTRKGFRSALQSEDVHYIQSQVNSSLSNLPNLDFIATTTMTGQVVSSTQKSTGLAAGFPYGYVSQKLTHQKSLTGFVDTPAGIMAIAAQTVISPATGQPMGVFVVGNVLSQADLAQIGSSLQIQVGVLSRSGVVVTTDSHLTKARLKDSLYRVLEQASGNHVSIVASPVPVSDAAFPLYGIRHQVVGVVRVQTSSAFGKALMQELNRSDLIVGAFIAFLLLIVGVLLQIRIIRPLNFFVTTLGQIASGEFTGALTSQERADPKIATAFERLYRFAYFDYLTGLPNRLQFHSYLVQQIQTAVNTRQHIALLYLDLDRFKYINDTLGHTTGDNLLMEVAKRLTSSIGPDNFAARLGGDEFTVIVPNAENINVTKLADSIIEAFRVPFSVGEFDLYVTTSIGISIFPLDATSVEGLLQNADTAMYQAKAKGRNERQTYTSEMHHKTLDRLQLETDLYKAIERNQFVIYYQPFMDVKSDRVVGLEALIRWVHPELGLVPPGDFIPLAEETGLIISIGEWVLKQACSQMKTWLDEGLPRMYIAVNLSPLQFQHYELVKTVSRALEESGLDAELLELEITESVMMEHVEDTIAILNQLKNLGVTVSIDDFGTGYSSLAYLQKFPIDVLKIDQSFVRKISPEDTDATIAKTILTLGHNLKLRVVAEGVESEYQRDLLKVLECDITQGYLHSRPLPPDTMKEFIVALKGSN